MEHILDQMRTQLRDMQQKKNELEQLYEKQVLSITKSNDANQESTFNEADKDQTQHSQHYQSDDGNDDMMVTSRFYSSSHTAQFDNHVRQRAAERNTWNRFMEQQLNGILEKEYATKVPKEENISTSEELTENNELENDKDRTTFEAEHISQKIKAEETNMDLPIDRRLQTFLEQSENNSQKRLSRRITSFYLDSSSDSFQEQTASQSPSVPSASSIPSSPSSFSTPLSPGSAAIDSPASQKK